MCGFLRTDSVLRCLQIASTVDVLLSALHTPSEAVQRACATCLPGLVKHMKEQAAPLLARLQADLVHPSDFAVRRGAAYGLAGCVKGFGIAVLKSNDVMAVLEEAAQAKAPEPRQVHVVFTVDNLACCLALQSSVSVGLAGIRVMWEGGGYRWLAGENMSSLCFSLVPQGAMFAFECLSESLGLLFEPYVIRILPVLLKVQ